MSRPHSPRFWLEQKALYESESAWIAAIQKEAFTIGTHELRRFVVIQASADIDKQVLDLERRGIPTPED